MKRVRAELEQDPCVIDMTILSQTRKCPVGGLALHPVEGLVRVLDAKGFMRTVAFDVYEDSTRREPTSERREDIDVRQLRHIDVRRHLTGESRSS